MQTVRGGMAKRRHSWAAWWSRGIVAVQQSGGAHGWHGRVEALWWHGRAEALMGHVVEWRCSMVCWLGMAAAETWHSTLVVTAMAEVRCSTSVVMAMVVACMAHRW